MDILPREQFALALADIVSSAIKTAVEYDDGNHVLKPAVEFLRKALNEGISVYNLAPVDGDVSIYVAPYDEGEVEPMFETDAVMLSNLLINEANHYWGDVATFWAAVDAAVSRAKKEVSADATQ